MNLQGPTGYKVSAVCRLYNVESDVTFKRRSLGASRQRSRGITPKENDVKELTPQVSFLARRSNAGREGPEPYVVQFHY